MDATHTLLAIRHAHASPVVSRAENADPHRCRERSSRQGLTRTYSTVTPTPPGVTAALV